MNDDTTQDETTPEILNFNRSASAERWSLVEKFGLQRRRESRLRIPREEISAKP
jgi:hypothetical protein